jgi:hypothetical protein
MGYTTPRILDLCTRLSSYCGHTLPHLSKQEKRDALIGEKYTAPAFPLANRTCGEERWRDRKVGSQESIDFFCQWKQTEKDHINFPAEIYVCIFFSFLDLKHHFGDGRPMKMENNLNIQRSIFERLSMSLRNRTCLFTGDEFGIEKSVGRIGRS